MKYLEGSKPDRIITGQAIQIGEDNICTYDCMIFRVETQHCPSTLKIPGLLYY